ncbi:hypothetical protein T09_5111 [Trichinella sp. T9]|nr:hypothetical protein T09_5111 [Trichinella sp. T9]
MLNQRATFLQSYGWYTVNSQVLVNTDSHNWRNSILLVD